MQTRAFQWDDDNIEHIDRHNVTPEEAEDALLDKRRIATPAKPRRGEARWYALGATQEGRILAIIFTPRNGMIRVVTAYDAPPREKRRYRSRKGFRKR